MNIPESIMSFVDPVSVRMDGIQDQAVEILEKVNQKIAAAESLDAVMNFLFESTRGICPCDRLGLAFIEEENRRVVSHWARAHYEPILLQKGYSEDLIGSTLETIIDSRRVRIIYDLEAYLKIKPSSRSTRILVKEGVRSSMTCPLIVENRIVGLFWRSSRKPDMYDREQAAMHMFVAERLSQSVEKAYRIEQLTSAVSAYFEMLGFVSHELKSPVSSMVTNARMLLEGYYGSIQDEQRKQIEKIILKGEYLLGLVRDYLELARIEGGNLEVRLEDRVDIKQDVIKPAIDLIQSQMTRKEMHLCLNVTPDPYFAAVDPALLKIVMVNLLGNAVKYGSCGGSITVELSGSDETFNLSVTNDGPGFPESERQKLFRKFSRLNTPELKKEKGTGVGLYTVWRIVRAHEGTIDAVSEPGRWASFRIKMPGRADISIDPNERT